MPDPELSFFGAEFVKYYADHVHGYLCVFVCVFGTIANVLNMIVFTRKHMISPINTILCFLALVDLILLLVCFPIVWYFYLRPNSDHLQYSHRTYEYALFMRWQLNIMDIFSDTSVWLTALVSLWRYIAIAYPLKNLIWCNMRNVFKMVALVFLLRVLLQGPAFFTNSVFSITVDNSTAYFVGYSASSAQLGYLLKVDDFLSGIFFTLLPAVLITALSMKLLHAFSKMKKSCKNSNAAANSNTAYTRNEKQMTRTTLILIILSVVCLITYLPMSICRLSYYFWDEWERFQCWYLLKEFIFILGLSNSAFTLVIYYAISKQFRETFNAVFGIKSTQEVSIKIRRYQTSCDNTSLSTV